MPWLGDFATGVTFDTKFVTVNSTGTPTNMAGSPAVSIYKNNVTTEFTTGVTLTTNFDSRAGLSNLRVAMTNLTNFVTAANYQAVITAGTVGGISVVGYVVAEWSINNRPVQQIAANVITSTAIISNAITASKIASAAITAAKFGTGAITSTVFNTNAINSTVIGPAAIGASELGAAAITAAKFASGAITSTVINTNAIGASQLAAGAITAAKFASAAITSTVINTAAIGASQIAAAAISNTKFAAGAIDAAAIAADAIGSSEIAQTAAQEIADEVLDRNLAGGGSGNTRNVRNALRALRNKQNITTGTLTVYAEDDSTSAWTAVVTTSAGNPISDIDPA